ncbi:MAG: AzlD domain-containing protein [Arcanobacterium sp.]|nr:AzlD domain-containing protein [Arcanobacterium sp.]
MTFSFWLFLSCLVAFVIKACGFFLPESYLDRPVVTKIAGSVTVGLLAALIATNTFVTEQEIVVDARLGALAVAVAGFSFRLPFILVVLLGAAAAALLRFLGMP